jgi:CIC family chloride channel protein
MASVLGSVLGAPLTAVVFAFELTHDANALLPVLLATAVAHGFNTLTMRRSIMTEKIARRGRHIYREYGLDPLECTHVGDLLIAHADTETPADMVNLIRNATVVVPGDTARSAASRMATHGVTRLPVVTDRVSLRFIGVLELASLLEPSRTVHHEDTLRERLR